MWILWGCWCAPRSPGLGPLWSISCALLTSSVICTLSDRDVLPLFPLCLTGSPQWSPCWIFSIFRWIKCSFGKPCKPLCGVPATWDMSEGMDMCLCSCYASPLFLRNWVSMLLRLPWYSQPLSCFVSGNIINESQYSSLSFPSCCFYPVVQHAVLFFCFVFWSANLDLPPLHYKDQRWELFPPPMEEHGSYVDHCACLGIKCNHYLAFEVHMGENQRPFGSAWLRGFRVAAYQGWPPSTWGLHKDILYRVNPYVLLVKK